MQVRPLMVSNVRFDVAPAITPDILAAQDDTTAEVLIAALAGNSTFDSLARREFAGLVQRDAADAEQLQQGVDLAISRGLLPRDLVEPRYVPINMLGRRADEVADRIIADLLVGRGCVVVVVGLSGVGKGTVVEKMRSKVAKSSTWSNGNCFRALTLLALTWCEQQNVSFHPSCLTLENLSEWAGMLQLRRANDKFDIRIEGLGIDAWVSDVANTLLKDPRVSRNVPVVARETQGEVVRFAAEAVRQMGDAGAVVFLEGREQTLNFMPSEHRFRLVISDTYLIGARRAAQRVAAAAHARVAAGDDPWVAINVALDAMS